MDLHSGLPFWLIKNGLPFDYPKLQENIKTDVVIIGGGITGALCAYYLINAGIETVVVDGRTIGIGSTCASTSLLQYEIDTPLHKLIELVGPNNAIRSYQLGQEAIHKLQKISVEVGSAPFKFRKSCQFASYKKDLSSLEKECELRNNCGIRVDLLSKSDIKSLFPFSREMALLSDLGAETDAYQLTHLLHQYSIKKGVRVFDRTEIKEFNHRAVILKTSEGCTIKAKKIVYATGYESSRYIKEDINQLNSTYAISSEQFSTDNFWYENCLIWETATPYLYMRTTADKRIIVGGKDEEFYNPKHRDALLNKKRKQLEQSFLKLFPSISFKSEYAWCGTFAETKDGLPYIGVHKNIPNSYFALGYGGNGITFSLIAAEIIRDLILGIKNIDQDIFKFNR